MASTSIQIPPSTSYSSSIYRRKYEVFLSFRGLDTRCGFTGHLHAALKKMGIVVFRDDEELQGEKIHPGLKDAIEESQYAVVIISENFSGSKSCLFELAVIMERRRTQRLTVFPVFYHVDPSNVRNQAGSFGDAFTKLKFDIKVGTENSETWKATLNEIGDYSADSSKVVKDPLKLFGDALEEVGKLSGWHVKKDSDESKIIEEIGLKIFGRLIQNTTGIDESLVGIESPAKKIMDLLGLELGGVRFIGICGMGGIGKTTLAEVIYQRASSEFETCCFIYHIGESKDNRIVVLQKQLISTILSREVANSLSSDHEIIMVLKSRLGIKKVLIVLDDVCQIEQVKALAGSSKWFAEGSRIIITSRNHHLPPYLCKDNIYEVKELNYNDSLQLFCSKAFKNRHPQEEFKRLIVDIVDFAGGLPLALEVFGSFLCDEEKSIWESYLVQLKANLDASVAKKLRITFNGLEDLAQEMFLDIVCFFDGYGKDTIISKLKCLEYPSESILKDLERKSLIKFERKSLMKFDEKEELFVHDLLKQMGQQIAKHSRLWRIEDIFTVLREKTGIAEIRGLSLVLIYLNKRDEENICTLCFEALSKMKNLRMLKIIGRNHILMEDAMHKCYQDISKFKLSVKLRVMEWEGYPLESLPTGPSFQPSNLVVLALEESRIKRLWHGYKRFLKLKHINLNGSKELIEITDVSQFPNLETLDLSWCTSLTTVDSSIGLFKCLKKLLLRCCECLEQLPDMTSLKSLEVLDVSWCSKLKSFPDISGEMPFLWYLDISRTPIKEFPFSFLKLPSLEVFRAEKTHIEELPFDIIFSKRLRELIIECHDSNTIVWHPTSFSPLSTLKGLPKEAASIDLNGLSMCSREEPEEFLEALFSSLRSLSEVTLNNCNLGAIPKSIGCWPLVSKLDLSKNKFTKLPDSMCELSTLGTLVLNHCISLRALPKLPLNLKNLELRNCPLLEVFNSVISDQIANKMLGTHVCSSTIAYVGFDCKPHKVLYSNAQSFSYTKRQEHNINLAVACGPTLGSSIPDWFIHKSISFRTKTILQMDWDFTANSRHQLHACALLIVYEIHEHDERKSRKTKSNELENLNIGVCEGTSPNIGACEGSNCTFPEFVCQLRLDSMNQEYTFVICLPEVAPVGSYGVWVFVKIPSKIFLFRDLISTEIQSTSCLTSIIASNKNVVLKQSGARLLDKDALLEFSQLVNSISQPGLDSKSLDDSLKCCLESTLSK